MSESQGDAKSSLKLLKRKAKLKRRRSRDFENENITTNVPCSQEKEVEEIQPSIIQSSNQCTEDKQSYDNLNKDKYEEIGGQSCDQPNSNLNNFENSDFMSNEQEEDEKSYERVVVVWRCNECGNECIPVREESRFFLCFCLNLFCFLDVFGKSLFRFNF